VPNDSSGPFIALAHEMRGPDPAGDWFAVLVDGKNETAIDQVFATEGATQAEATPTPLIAQL